MSEIHLSAGRWRALLAGKLPADEASALRAHLEEPCERCETAMAEAALADEGGPDPLDGLADEALLGAREEAWPADQLAGARLARRLDRRPRRLLFAGAATAVAAAAMIFVTFGLPEGPGDGVRLKGSSVSALPELQFARVGADGGLSPIPPGGSVAHAGHLLLRFRSPRDGVCGHLQVTSGGEELLARESLCLSAGSSTLSEAGQVVALALDDPSLGDTVEVSFEGEAGAPARATVRLLAP